MKQKISVFNLPIILLLVIMLHNGSVISNGVHAMSLGSKSVIQSSVCGLDYLPCGVSDDVIKTTAHMFGSFIFLAHKYDNKDVQDMLKDLSFDAYTSDLGTLCNSGNKVACLSVQWLATEVKEVGLMF